MAQTPEREPGAPAQRNDLDERSIERLAEALGDLDLCVYKRGTIGRRVSRRMALLGLDLEAYVAHVCEDRTEQVALTQELLISVTEMFRDPEAFEVLRTAVIEPLVEAAAPGDTLRVWVPGCATGEEAYSIAIELFEAIARRGTPLALQMFATDVDAEALVVARAGVYSSAIAEHVEPGLLDRYFEALDDSGYRVRSRLREVVSFSVHDLAKDPPFSRMNLISCRNVLIYLEPKTQQYVLSVLHFALQPEAHLLLGSSESTGPRRRLFSTVSKKWRIFRKVGVSRPFRVAPRGAPPLVRREDGVMSTGSPAGPEPERARRKSGLDDDRARRAIMKALVPPTIAVGDAGTVLYMHGELRPYLRFPDGDPRFELSALVDPELATRVRSALYKCRREGRTVVTHSSPDSTRPERIRVTAAPALELGDGVVILTFEELPEQATPPPPPSAPDSSNNDTVIEQLEKELLATREDLRSAVDELEASNEELLCSNEESTSINEELQSVNEELEATTEELRSLNEELSTVNAQLREKVEQLEAAHNDIANFFASTRIATLFLDERLCIKRFTPSAEELVRIDRGDQGRFVGDIARELLQNGLADQARTVLEQLDSQTREIYTTDGRWITRRVLPYRTENRRIEGVVVTFVDVTALKSTSEQLSVRERQQAVIARLGLRALEDSDLQTFLDHCVREIQQTLGTDMCKILELQPGAQVLLLRSGVGWSKGLVGRATVGADLDSQAGYTLHCTGPVIVDDLRQERRFRGPPLLLEHDVRSGLSCIIRGLGGPYGVLGVHSRDLRRFTQEDAYFMLAVGAVIAGAISHHQTRARQVLEVAAARALAEADDLRDAVRRLHAAAVEVFEADVTELWEPSADGQMLERTHVLAAHPFSSDQIERRLTPSRFELSDGARVPCRVHTRQCAEWMTSLQDRQQFSRIEPAQRLGLCSGLALPISSGDEHVGVMMCFSRGHIHADDVLLRSLEAIGRSLGELSSRKHAEQELRRSETRFRQVLVSSPVPLMLHDDAGQIVALSRSWTDVTGYALKNIPTSEAWIRAAFRERAAEIIAIGEGVWDAPPSERRYELEIWTKDGERKTLSFESVPLGENSAGRRLRLVSAVDVTQQRRFENDLVEASHQKDEFIAMLGHELRNPLAAVSSAAEILKLPRPDLALITRVQVILARQTRHMAKLLDGLLDVSRIARGTIRVERRVIDLRTAARDLVSDFLSRPSTEGIELRSDLADEPLWAEVDAVRWTQILDNLLSNAVKYTPASGTIEVRLGRAGNEAVLVVRDTGVGIDPELLPHVFEPFRQAHQNLDRPQGGLGLGLALVKRLVELHGGTVQAHSDGVGQGAELTIRLPLTQARSQPAPRRSLPPGTCRILLIEDSEDAAEMLRAALELRGHEVAVALRGAVGLELARELEPNVVLCDIELPDGISGFDVAATLRADPRTKHIRLVSLSGYARDEVEPRCRAAGFDAHLLKPVSLDQIDLLLRTLGVVEDRAE